MNTCKLMKFLHDVLFTKITSASSAQNPYTEPHWQAYSMAGVTEIPLPRLEAR